MSPYKYVSGNSFIINGFNMKIIRTAKIDEFGADFHWSENNYVVEFYDQNGKMIDDKLLATYNFNYNGEFKYVMTESDFDYKNFCKMEILRN